MRYNAMIPELTVFDIQKTKQFYLSILGFRLEYERAEEGFLFTSYGESQFMFEQFHEDGWNTGRLCRPLGLGVNFSIEVEEIETLYRRLQQQGVAFYRGLSTARYETADGMMEQKEFLLQDPDGYLLRFTHARET